MQDENSGLFRRNRSDKCPISSIHDFVFRNVVVKCTVLHGLTDYFLLFPFVFTAFEWFAFPLIRPRNH